MTDAVDVALPPMPEPKGCQFRYDHTGSLLPEPSFSADQVRAYAIQAVMATLAMDAHCTITATEEKARPNG